MQINSAKDLEVYKKAYAVSMEIFQLSRSWPAEERYSLTDQVRRSSRSVCSNLREAWGSAGMKHTSSQSCLTVMAKTVKPIHGLITHEIAGISLWNNMLK